MPDDPPENMSVSPKEDSQQSITLRDALKPLDDTQPDTGLGFKLDFETNHQLDIPGQDHKSAGADGGAAFISPVEQLSRCHEQVANASAQRHDLACYGIVPNQPFSRPNEDGSVTAGLEHSIPDLEDPPFPASLLSRSVEHAGVTPEDDHHRPAQNGTSSFQLISRRQEHAAGIPDLDVGFHYGKHVTFKPGQFSRPTTAKMRESIVDNGTQKAVSSVPKTMSTDEQTRLENDDPIQTPFVAPSSKSMCMPIRQQEFPDEIPKQQLTVASTGQPISQEQAHFHPVFSSQHRVVNETPGKPHTVGVTRKQPPFSDYHPIHQATPHEDQLPAPVAGPKMTSLDRSIPSRLDGSHAGANRGQLRHKDNQRRPPSQDTEQKHQQKQRTSFQNDVSVVPSAQPPRTLSQLTQRASPRLGMMNRSVRDDQRPSSSSNTPNVRPRTSSSIASKSNVKTKRSAAPVLASSPRSSNYSTPREQDTPSMRQRKYTADHLRARCLQTSMEKKAEFVRCLNEKFELETEAENNLLQVIAHLEQNLKRQQDRASGYKKQTQAQDKWIHELEAGHDQVISQLEATKQELEERSTKFSKLENKCRTYKEYLNTAISEQQSLYKASREKCEGAIAQMRVEERKHQVSLELERKQAEAVRERLSQRVKAVIDEAKHKDEQLHDKVVTLNQKIQEREAEILRERETGQVLLQQQDSIAMIQDTLKIFGTQIEEAVSKVNELASRQSQQGDTKAEALHVKIDKITENLQTLDERFVSNRDVHQELQGLNEKAVASILGKLEPILESQLETKKDLNSLCVGLGEYVDELWQGLEEREDVVVNHIAQKQAEEAHQMASLREQLQASEQDCAQERELYFNSQANVMECQHEISKLRAEIEELEHAQADTYAQFDRLEQLEGEHTRLKEETASKAAQLSELQVRLQESKSALEMEDEKHRKSTEELLKLVEQRVAEAQAMQVKAVEDAQREAVRQMNEVKEDVEKRLQQAAEARTTLQRELDAAKQQAMVMGDESSIRSEKIHSLEKELETSRTEAARFKEEVSQRNSARQLEHAEELQSQLAMADKKYNKLAENAQAYDKAARIVLQSIKQWTADYAAVQNIAVTLNKKQDGDIAQIDPKFKPLVQLQILQKAALQYCQTQEEAVEELSRREIRANTAFNAQNLHGVGTIQESSRNAVGILLDRIRRATINSPAGIAGSIVSPRPPSVQTEQELRRAADPPRSILKSATYAPQQLEKDELPQGCRTRKSSTRNGSRDTQQQGNPNLSTQRSLLNRSSLNRGPYNRPVASKTSVFDLPVEAKSTASGYGDSEQAPAMGQGRKRKGIPAQEPEASRQTPTKKPRTTLTRKNASILAPHASPKPEPDNHADHDRPPRALRRTDRSIGSIDADDEQPRSPIRPSQSQASNPPTTGFVATSTGPKSWVFKGTMPSTRRASSLSSGQDPLALFQRPHSGHVKQDSKVSGDQPLLPLSRHFTADP